MKKFRILEGMSSGKGSPDQQISNKQTSGKASGRQGNVHEGDRRTVKQVMVLLLVFGVIMTLMVAGFSVESKKNSKKEAYRQLIEIAEDHAKEVYRELSAMVDAGKPLMRYLSRNINVSLHQIVGMAEAIRQETSAYAILYTDVLGNGFLHDGSRVDMEELWYYQETNKRFEEIEAANPERDGIVVEYMYVPDDELKIGKEAILAVMKNLNGEGRKLYMFFPVEKMPSTLRRGSVQQEEYSLLINEQGYILSATMNTAGLAAGDNIWNIMINNQGAANRITNAREGIKNHLSGSVEDMAGGNNYVYAPIGINNWAVLVKIEDGYMNDYVMNHLKEDMKMTYQISAVIAGFLLAGFGIFVGNKIRALKKAKEMTERMDTDALTGLYNKAATERKIREYMMENPKGQGMLFIVDLDYFKRINDTLGHAFGDEVLRSFGHRVTALFRTSDIVGRTGGDEFVIFLKDVNEEQYLEAQAKKLGLFFEDFQVGEYVKYSVTASIGTAVFSKDGSDFESLYKAADSALYVSKERGRNQITFYKDAFPPVVGSKKLEKYSR